MTNIHKEINIQALHTEGYTSLATIYSILETTEAEVNFVHFMYDMAEREQDNKLFRLIYPIITSTTGWSFNPYMLINP